MSEDRGDFAAEAAAAPAPATATVTPDLVVDTGEIWSLLGPDARVDVARCAVAHGDGDDPRAARMAERLLQQAHEDLGLMRGGDTEVTIYEAMDGEAVTWNCLPRVLRMKFAVTDEADETDGCLQLAGPLPAGVCPEQDDMIAHVARAMLGLPLMARVVRAAGGEAVVDLDLTSQHGMAFTGGPCPGGIRYRVVHGG